MHLADLVRSEHDIFSCWTLKNTTREQIRLYTLRKSYYIIVKTVGSFHIKFGYSEKATKFEKIFHLKFDATRRISELYTDKP